MLSPEKAHATVIIPFNPAPPPALLTLFVETNFKMLYGKTETTKAKTFSRVEALYRDSDISHTHLTARNKSYHCNSTSQNTISPFVRRKTSDCHYRVTVPFPPSPFPLSNQRSLSLSVSKQISSCCRKKKKLHASKLTILIHRAAVLL